MERYSDLRNEIRYLTALTSLLFKRPPEPEKPQRARGDDNNEYDEAEFEDELATPDAEEALGLLKRKALDRLAEVLAGFKTGHQQNNQKGKKTKDKTTRSVDAKHVTGVVMVENADCVTIVCAKNEGLDEVDEVFLHRLGGLLEGIASRRPARNDDVYPVFDIMFQHNERRVKFYSDILHCEFDHISTGTFSSDDTLNGLQNDGLKQNHRPTAPRQWQGLDIQLNSDQKPAGEGSEAVDDCLSDTDGETLVNEVFGDINRLFRHSNEDPNRSTQMKSWLQSFFAIIKHPKQRPALKSRIRQRLNYDDARYLRVWSALLFLGRTFHAAVLLAEVASKVNSFNRVRFVQVPKHLRAVRLENLPANSPIETLRKFGLLPSDSAWIRYFQHRGVIKHYQKLLCSKTTVHAETQLMYFFEEQFTENTIWPGGNVSPYIGCSKKCCFFCDLLCRQHGRFSARGTHETVLPQWGLPSMPPGNTSKLTTSLLTAVEKLRDVLKGEVGAATHIPYPLRRCDLARQSTANLSTAAVVQRELPFFNGRPSAVTMQDGNRLNQTEFEVFNLFATIQPAVWRHPGTDSSAWTNFGFCYCRTFKQREELCQKYRSLVASGTTFGEFVSAYETSTLENLMVARGVDISSLLQQGIKLTKPHGSEYAVFRLMLSVDHALSGRYCSCFRVHEGRKCHWYFETHIDIECDNAYGFHLTNSWERWQLLNFYKHLFSLPGFDARDMAKATIRPERDSLERYLNTLVPDMRKKIMDLDRVSTALFPILTSRTEVWLATRSGEESSRHVPCHCRVHDLIGPPGLSFFPASSILDRPRVCPS
ncbi:hypothetical protein BDV06DRAFT_235213 [Aspergillus oleicola]